MIITVFFIAFALGGVALLGIITSLQERKESARLLTAEEERSFEIRRGQP